MQLPRNIFMDLATKSPLECRFSNESCSTRRQAEPLTHTMHSIPSASLPAFHPDSGINLIARRSAAQPVYSPDGDLHPADSAAQPRLAQLFPLSSFEDFIWERLTPEFASTAFLKPARFRQSLSTLRSSVRSLAKADPERSRCYGKLAMLLDDQDELARLAHMYFCALIQG